MFCPWFTLAVNIFIVCANNKQGQGRDFDFWGTTDLYLDGITLTPEAKKYKCNVTRAQISDWNDKPSVFKQTFSILGVTDSRQQISFPAVEWIWAPTTKLFACLEQENCLNVHTWMAQLLIRCLCSKLVKTEDLISCPQPVIIKPWVLHIQILLTFSVTKCITKPIYGHPFTPAFLGLIQTCI